MEVSGRKLARGGRKGKGQIRVEGPRMEFKRTKVVCAASGRYIVGRRTADPADIADHAILSA